LTGGTPVSGGPVKRPGRVRVILLLAAGVVALGISIIGMSTREASTEYRGVEGVSDTQRIFGGVRQLGDRLGREDAPVQIQVFTDVQSAGYADWFEDVIPSLTTTEVRSGEVLLLLRNRSLTRNPTELSFFGIEAAGEQDYAWNYAYLVVRNLELAKEVGLDDEFLADVAGSIDGLEPALWEVDYEAALEPDSEVTARLEEHDKLAISLGLRAAPATVVAGPSGTEVLQDAPALADVQRAIAEVR
jgi:hypothetical protein